MHNTHTQIFFFTFDTYVFEDAYFIERSADSLSISYQINEHQVWGRPNITFDERRNSTKFSIWLHLDEQRGKKICFFLTQKIKKKYFRKLFMN